MMAAMAVDKQLTDSSATSSWENEASRATRSWAAARSATPTLAIATLHCAENRAASRTTRDRRSPTSLRRAATVGCRRIATVAVMPSRTAAAAAVAGVLLHAASGWSAVDASAAPSRESGDTGPGAATSSCCGEPAPSRARGPGAAALSRRKLPSHGCWPCRRAEALDGWDRSLHVARCMLHCSPRAAPCAAGLQPRRPVVCSGRTVCSCDAQLKPYRIT